MARTKIKSSHIAIEKDILKNIILKKIELEELAKIIFSVLSLDGFTEEEKKELKKLYPEFFL